MSQFQMQLSAAPHRYSKKQVEFNVDTGSDQLKNSHFIESGLLVQWHDSRLGCERSRVRLPDRPLLFLLLRFHFHNVTRTEKKSNQKKKQNIHQFKQIVKHTSNMGIFFLLNFAGLWILQDGIPASLITKRLPRFLHEKSANNNYTTRVGMVKQN